MKTTHQKRGKYRVYNRGSLIAVSWLIKKYGFYPTVSIIDSGSFYDEPTDSIIYVKLENNERYVKVMKVKPCDKR